MTFPPMDSLELSNHPTPGNDDISKKQNQLSLLLLQFVWGWPIFLCICVAFVFIGHAINTYVLYIVF